MRRSASGFTIIELVVAMALASILIGVLAFTFQQTSRLKSITDARIEGVRSVQAAFDGMERDLRQVLPVDSGGFNFKMVSTEVSGPDPLIRSDALRFVSRTSVAGDVRLVEITYSLNGQRLERSVQPLISTANVLTTDGAASADVLIDRLESFTLRFLPRTFDDGEAGKVYLDPDTSGGATETGAAFVGSGTEDGAIVGGEFSASGADRVKLGLFDENDSISLFRPSGPSIGFAPGRFTVQTVNPGANPTIDLIENVADTDSLTWQAILYPRGISVEVRIRDRVGVTSITRNMRVGG